MSTCVGVALDTNLLKPVHTTRASCHSFGQPVPPSLAAVAVRVALPGLTGPVRRPHRTGRKGWA
jgi:hypothetical protein